MNLTTKSAKLWPVEQRVTPNEARIIAESVKAGTPRVDVDVQFANGNVAPVSFCGLCDPGTDWGDSDGSD